MIKKIDYIDYFLEKHDLDFRDNYQPFLFADVKKRRELLRLWLKYSPNYVTPSRKMNFKTFKSNVKHFRAIQLNEEV